MKRRPRNLGEDNTNDYAKLAEYASKEMRIATKSGNELLARQAVNKAYLATVHAARAIVACSGATSDSKESSRSTKDIGRVFTIVGQRKLRDEQTNQVLRAFSKALGQHTNCFYDGICSMPEMADTVRYVRKALKHVPHTCHRVRGDR
jgi:uncharacterized protein (UPF0332 family)